MMIDPASTNLTDIFTFLIQIQVMSQRTLLRQFMHSFVEQSKKRNAISFNNFEEIILRLCWRYVYVRMVCTVLVLKTGRKI